jgi:hypothetical protein
MEIAHLIIDVIAGIVVPIFIALFGRKVIKDATTPTRLNNMEKQLREHIRGFDDEVAEEMEKDIDKIFSNPAMHFKG